MSEERRKELALLLRTAGRRLATVASWVDKGEKLDEATTELASIRRHCTDAHEELVDLVHQQLSADLAEALRKRGRDDDNEGPKEG